MKPACSVGTLDFSSSAVHQLCSVKLTLVTRGCFVFQAQRWHLCRGVPEWPVQMWPHLPVQPPPDSFIKTGELLQRVHVDSAGGCSLCGVAPGDELAVSECLKWLEVFHFISHSVPVLPRDACSAMYEGHLHLTQLSDLHTVTAERERRVGECKKGVDGCWKEIRKENKGA